MENLQNPPTSTSVDDGKNLRAAWNMWFTMLGQKINDIITDVTSISASLNAVESAELTLLTTNAYNVYSFTHGLGSTPKYFDAFIRCKTAELGYSVGDEVKIAVANTTAPAYYIPPTIKANPTIVSLIVPGNGTTVLLALQNGTGGFTNVTAANWKLVIRARLIA
jgi:hypothetical protein